MSLNVALISNLPHNYYYIAIKIYQPKTKKGQKASQNKLRHNQKKDKATIILKKKEKLYM